jgi:hypothetical protein
VSDVTRNTLSVTPHPVFVKRTVMVGLSVRDLAEAFATLAADEQASFFELVGEIMGWEPHQREMQMHYMAREIIGNKDALAFVDSLGESVAYPARSSAPYRHCVTCKESAEVGDDEFERDHSAPTCRVETIDAARETDGGGK